MQSSFSRIWLPLALISMAALQPTGVWAQAMDDSDTAAEQVRSPVPGADLQAAALAKAQKLYAPEQASGAVQSALAMRIISELAGVQDQPERYVLLNLALDLAVRAGDVDTATAAIQQISEQFEVDELALKSGIVPRLLLSLRSPDSFAQLAEYTCELLEQLSRAEAFDLTGDLANPALQAARRSTDASLVRRVTNQIRDIRTTRKAFDDYQQARQALELNPDDGRAHQQAGRYLCFHRTEWSTGIGHFARCDNEALKALAILEAASPTAANVQLSIADGWWDQSSQERDLVRTNIRLHAATWYGKAVSGASDLDRRRIEQRLNELSPRGQRFVRNFDLHKPNELKNWFRWTGAWAGTPPKGAAVTSGQSGYRGWIETRKEIKGDFELKMHLILTRSQWTNRGSVKLLVFNEAFDVRGPNDWHKGEFIIHFGRKGNQMSLKVNDALQQRTLSEQNWYAQTPIRLWCANRLGVAIKELKLEAAETFDP